VKKLVILFGALFCLGNLCSVAQQESSAAVKPTATPKSPGVKHAPGKTKQAAAGSVAGTQSNDLFGPSDGRPKGPTEITATQEAQFDTKNRTGVFVGNVKVVDPQFTMTADRLTVHLSKDQDGGGLNEADAQGHVVIVHVNQPKTQGQPTQTSGQPAPAVQTPAAGPGPGQAQQPPISVGKADNALYEAKDGTVTLTGWPQVTQGLNTHIATAPGVKMVLFKDGRMQTYGSTRTLIEDKTTTATNNSNANSAQ
jgi:lipopolysaccharide export system protein LptA